MFKTMLALIAIGTSPAFATESMRGYYVGTCNAWTLVNSSNGPSWGCSILPKTVVVADGNDVGESFADVNGKIAALEKRIEALERRCASEK